MSVRLSLPADRQTHTHTKENIHFRSVRSSATVSAAIFQPIQRDDLNIKSESENRERNGGRGGSFHGRFQYLPDGYPQQARFQEAGGSVGRHFADEREFGSPPHRVLQNFFPVHQKR